MHEELFASWVSRLRREYPQAVGLYVHGSYATGLAGRYSDLDLDLIFVDDPPSSYRSVIEEQSDGSLLHTTIGSYSIESWLEQFEQQEAEEWTYFLPVRKITRLLWSAPAYAELLAQHTIIEHSVSPQVQDMIEGACKVRNAFAIGNELAVRLAAQNLAVRCPGVLAMINPPIMVGNSAEALAAALAMPHTPPQYRDDLLVCLGLSGSATTITDVFTCALRLVIGIVEMIRPHAEELADRIEPDLPLYLTDGRLMRLLVDP